MARVALRRSATHCASDITWPTSKEKHACYSVSGCELHALSPQQACTGTNRSQPWAEPKAPQTQKTNQLDHVGVGVKFPSMHS
eukprot:10608418-Alexandrium_andersonii.AAC.1